MATKIAEPGYPDWSALALAALIAGGSAHEWVRMLGASVAGASLVQIALCWIAAGKGE